MSQHKILSHLNREVIYGSDKPTGGFFFSEFYREDEITDEMVTECVVSKDGLTLRELKDELFRRYAIINLDSKSLRKEWELSPEPTGFQVNTAKMFGKDLPSMIMRVNRSFELEDKRNIYMKELGF